MSNIRLGSKHDNIGLGGRHDNILFMQAYWYTLSYMQRINVFLNLFNIDIRYSVYSLSMEECNNDE